MQLPAQHSNRFVAAGALGIALTTAAEVWTAPYSAHVMIFGLNPAVHAVKIVAILVFAVGMLALALSRRQALGRVGVGGAGALAAGATAAALPYSVVETLLSPGLTPAQATAWLDTAYEGDLAWVGYLGMAGMLLTLGGLIALAVVVLGRRLLPRWRPLLSLAALPLGVLAGVLGETTGLPVPHPPAWLFLCIGIAYAAPLPTGSQRRSPATPGHRPVGAAAS